MCCIIQFRRPFSVLTESSTENAEAAPAWKWGHCFLSSSAARLCSGVASGPRSSISIELGKTEAVAASSVLESTLPVSLILIGYVFCVMTACWVPKSNAVSPAAFDNWRV